MKRKTIEVEEIKKRANDFMRNGYFNAEQRKIIQSFVEAILMDTGNYKGLNYNYWLDKGYDEWIAAGQPDFPEKYKYLGDQSQVTFY